MNIPRHIFKAYDIRGLLAEVTPEIAEAVGFALVEKTGAKRVVVGRDMRETSPELAVAAMRGITKAGAGVADVGMCSTSMFNFAVSSVDDFDAGLMITASHNPKEYNGIKLAFSSGLPISGQSILELVEKEQVDSFEQGKIEEIGVLDEYLGKCIDLADAPDLSGTKIVVDYGNGMGSVSVRDFLSRLGVESVELYPEPDASFPNHEANPAKEETLADLKKAVLSEGADFGVALDGDADRIGFVDNEGQSLRGDQMLAVLARHILKTKPGATIISAPNQGWAPMDAMRELGANIVDCRIGRTNVINAMDKEGAALGGEVSSHFFYDEFNNLESVDYTLALALAVWKRSGEPFAELVRDLRSYVNSGEINTEVEDKEKVLKALEEKYAPIASIVNKLDGIRCEFDRDWWFIVRPSNTEPLIRLIVEAKSEELMKERRDEVLEVIKS
ncbi:MAG: phosphomannomutase/phosphoglucomutase [bacterium]